MAKAEHIDGKENPRFVVTSLTAEAWVPQALYEELYCARGERENRIKDNSACLPSGSEPRQARVRMVAACAFSNSVPFSPKRRNPHTST